MSFFDNQSFFNNVNGSSYYMEPIDPNNYYDMHLDYHYNNTLSPYWVAFIDNLSNLNAPNAIQMVDNFEEIFINTIREKSGDVFANDLPRNNILRRVRENGWDSIRFTDLNLYARDMTNSIEYMRNCVNQYNYNPIYENEIQVFLSDYYGIQKRILFRLREGLLNRLLLNKTQLIIQNRPTRETVMNVFNLNEDIRTLACTNIMRWIEEICKAGAIMDESVAGINGSIDGVPMAFGGSTLNLICADLMNAANIDFEHYFHNIAECKNNISKEIENYEVLSANCRLKTFFIDCLKVVEHIYRILEKEQ